MSERRHTPGPWVWRGKSGSLHRVGDPPYPFGETVMSPSYEYDSGVDIEFPNEANFDLITAAPDLFEALEPFEEHARHHAADAPEWTDSSTVSLVVNVRDLRAVLAAIAKAKGDAS